MKVLLDKHCDVSLGKGGKVFLMIENARECDFCLQRHGCLNLRLQV